MADLYRNEIFSNPITSGQRPDNNMTFNPDIISRSPYPVVATEPRLAAIEADVNQWVAKEAPKVAANETQVIDVPESTASAGGAVDPLLSRVLQPFQQQEQQGGPVRYGVVTDRATSTQIKPGRPVDVGYLKDTGENMIRGAQVAEGISDVEAEERKLSSEEIADTLSKIGEDRAKFMQEQETLRQKMQEQETRIVSAQQDLAKAEIDPNRWWNSRTAWQKVAIGVGAGIGGFLKGYTDGRVEGGVLRMIDNEVNKDIMLQREVINRKKENITGQENALSYLYKRLGTIQEAEQALYNANIGQMKLRLQKIAESGASKMVRWNAAKVAIGLEEKQNELRHGEWLAAQDQIVKTENVQQRKVPLSRPPSRLAQPKPLPGKVREQLNTINTIRDHLDQFAAEFKKLKLPLKAASWYGEQTEAVADLQKRVTASLAGQIGAPAKDVANALVSPLGNNENMLTRVTNILREQDARAANIIKTWGYDHNMLPTYQDEIKRRYYQKTKYGMKYPDYTTGTTEDNQ